MLREPGLTGSRKQGAAEPRRETAEAGGLKMGQSQAQFFNKQIEKATGQMLDTDRTVTRTSVNRV